MISFSPTGLIMKFASAYIKVTSVELCMMIITAIER